MGDADVDTLPPEVMRKCGKPALAQMHTVEEKELRRKAMNFMITKVRDRAQATCGVGLPFAEKELRRNACTESNVLVCIAQVATLHRV